MLLRRPKILFLAASLLEGFKVCISFFVWNLLQHVRQDKGSSGGPTESTQAVEICLSIEQGCLSLLGRKLYESNARA